MTHHKVPLYARKTAYDLARRLTSRGLFDIQAIQSKLYNIYILRKYLKEHPLNIVGPQHRLN